MGFLDGDLFNQSHIYYEESDPLDDLLDSLRDYLMSNRRHKASDPLHTILIASQMIAARSKTKPIRIQELLETINAVQISIATHPKEEETVVAILTELQDQLGGLRWQLLQRKKNHSPKNTPNLPRTDPGSAPYRKRVEYHHLLQRTTLSIDEINEEDALLTTEEKTVEKKTLLDWKPIDERSWVTKTWQSFIDSFKRGWHSIFSSNHAVPDAPPPEQNTVSPVINTRSTWRFLLCCFKSNHEETSSQPPHCAGSPAQKGEPRASSLPKSNVQTLGATVSAPSMPTTPSRLTL